jgi:hypothetical protein
MLVVDVGVGGFLRLQAGPLGSQWKLGKAHNGTERDDQTQGKDDRVTMA